MINNTIVDDIDKRSRVNGKANDGSVAESQLNERYDENFSLFRKWMFIYGKPKLRPTHRVKRWIKSQVRKYCKQIGISQQDIPTVVLTRAEVRAMPIDEVTTGLRNETSQYLGICFRKTRTIFMNVRKFASLEDLKHTIVHELVHYRFPYLRHGQRFEKRISLILNGKQYRSWHVHDTLSKNDSANGNNNNNRSEGRSK